MITVLPVLKIIGSVLLWVLAIVAALLLIVLFVPVCYRFAGTSEDPEPHEDPDLDKVKENLSGYFSFSWLFGFVRGGISYPDDPAFKVRILWFTVTGRNKPEKKKKKKIRTRTSDVHLLKRVRILKMALMLKAKVKLQILRRNRSINLFLAISFPNCRAYMIKSKRCLQIQATMSESYKVMSSKVLLQKPGNR